MNELSNLIVSQYSYVSVRIFISIIKQGNPTNCPFYRFVHVNPAEYKRMNQMRIEGNVGIESRVFGYENEIEWLEYH